MINTNCSQCMFANKVSDSDLKTGCSRNIIPNILGLKKIDLDENNYAIINNYACRFGFSKYVYEDHKKEFDKINLIEKIDNNAKLKIYLVIDCCINGPNIDNIIEELTGSKFLPKHISFLYRQKSNQCLEESCHSSISEKIPGVAWKVHNFLEEMPLNDSLEHVLSTNLSKSNCDYILVYSSMNYLDLNNDLLKINEATVLQQTPHIAMIKSTNSLYGLAISSQNYTVAKSISSDILQAITSEPDSLLSY